GGTVSRQLWSSLRTWLRKPQRVVTGLNSRSRYLTPCSLRASRMLISLKESAKGSPWSRAKRARTSSRVVRGGLKGLWCEWGGPRKRRGGPSPGKGRTSSNRLPPSLYPARPGNPLRLQLLQGQALAVKLVPFV